MLLIYKAVRYNGFYALPPLGPDKLTNGTVPYETASCSSTAILTKVPEGRHILARVVRPWIRSQRKGSVL